MLTVQDCCKSPSNRGLLEYHKNRWLIVKINAILMTCDNYDWHTSYKLSWKYGNIQGEELYSTEITL